MCQEQSVTYLSERAELKTDRFEVVFFVLEAGLVLILVLINPKDRSVSLRGFSAVRAAFCDSRATPT